MLFSVQFSLGDCDGIVGFDYRAVGGLDCGRDGPR